MQSHTGIQGRLQQFAGWGRRAGRVWVPALIALHGVPVDWGLLLGRVW
jgi:hypothetical protein